MRIQAFTLAAALFATSVLTGGAWAQPLPADS